MNADQVTALRILLGPTGWLEQTRLFARALRGRHPRAPRGGYPELDDRAHESLAVPPGLGPVSFDAAQHLVSAAAGEPPARTGLRGRLARLLDAVSGTSAPAE